MISNAEYEAAKNRHGVNFWDGLDDSQKKMMVLADRFLDYNSCVRLYNENGEHVLSVLRCHSGGFDIATPDGKVLWADCDGKWMDFWECLPGKFGVGKIDRGQ